MERSVFENKKTWKNNKARLETGKYYKTNIFDLEIVGNICLNTHDEYGLGTLLCCLSATVTNGVLGLNTETENISLSSLSRRQLRWERK